MNVETKQATCQIMAELAATPHMLLGTPVIEVGASRWMLPGGCHFIIQIELLHPADRAIMFSSVARDGSWPLKASFLTMLLLEDTIAHVQRQYGVCSGVASVTLYRCFDLEAITTHRMAAVLANFIGLSEIVLADYVVPPLPLDLQDIHDRA